MPRATTIRRRVFAAGLARRVARAGALLPLLWAAPALARRGVRPIFEPTDLELEKPGVLDVDVQVGAIRSQGPARVVIPDFEVDFGIFPNLELDVDGAYAIEGPAMGPFAFDHAAPDSLWLSLKIGLFDWNNNEDAPAGAAAGAPASADAWAIGLQVGPKLPVASGSSGVGAEGLLLVARVLGKTHLVLNSGAFIDPRPDPASGRPIGLELGLDLDRDLDAAGHFSLTGELSGVVFLSSDPRQLLATAGITWSATDSLDVSLIGLVGFLEGSDRYGVLLGLSPKVRLFH